MKVGFKRSFTKDLNRIKDKGLLRRVREAIELGESSWYVLKSLMPPRGDKGSIEHFAIRAPAPDDRQAISAIPRELPPATEDLQIRVSRRPIIRQPWQPSTLPEAQSCIWA